MFDKIKKLFNMKKEEKDLQVEAYNENFTPEEVPPTISEPELDDTLAEIEPTEEDKEIMKDPSADDSDYLEYAPEAVGYIHREQQWNTYRSIVNYLPEGASILDFGCGRGDFERFNQTENSIELDYIGIDMNQQLIDAGNKAYDNELDIRCENWFKLKDDVKQDWSININSNNLRYDTSKKTDEEYLYDTIDVMYEHATQGVLILLSSSIPNEDGGLIDNNPGNIFNWVQKKYGQAAIDHTISNDLFIIAIYKNRN